MLRGAYVWIVRLHPRRFRESFADEMLHIFDQVAVGSLSTTVAEAKLVGDGIVSLVRQWALRPEVQREPAATATTPPVADGVPGFYTFGSFKPRATALAHGLVLSVAVLCATFLAMRYSWNRAVQLPFPVVDRGENASSPEWETAIIPSVAAPDQHATQLPAGDGRAVERAARSNPSSVPGRSQPLQIEPTLPATVPHRKRHKDMQANSDGRAHLSAVPSALGQGINPVTLSPRLLRMYIGDYAALLPGHLTVSVVAEDGRLQIEFAGQPRRSLLPVSETKFLAEGLPDCEIEFQTNPDGTVRQLEIDQGGQRISAVRH